MRLLFVRPDEYAERCAEDEARQDELQASYDAVKVVAQTFVDAFGVAFEQATDALNKVMSVVGPALEKSLAPPVRFNPPPLLPMPPMRSTLPPAPVLPLPPVITPDAADRGW